MVNKNQLLVLHIGLRGLQDPYLPYQVILSVPDGPSSGTERFYLTQPSPTTVGVGDNLTLRVELVPLGLNCATTPLPGHSA